jgi:hypothetical protein
MLATAAATVLLAVGRWQVGEMGFLVGGCLVGHFLFPNDEVQQDDKDDEGDNNREPPVVFTREVDTRAVNLNDGDGSFVNLDCCDGKKWCDGDNSGTEEVGFDFKFHLTEDPPGRGRGAPVILPIC